MARGESYAKYIDFGGWSFTVRTKPQTPQGRAMKKKPLKNGRIEVNNQKLSGT